jgi:PAS domain S-box-containing protein
MNQKPEHDALKQRVDDLERESLDRKQAGEKIRENEERYRTLFENSRDAIIITTRDGQIVDINKAALELFGYTGEEIKEVGFQEFYVHPEDSKRFLQAIEQKGSVLDYEVDLLKKDGTKINCLLSVTVRLADDGSVFEYQGIIRDVSHRKRYENALRESEERFRMLAEDAPFGISIMKPDQTFEYFNPKFTEILGYTIDDLPDKGAWFKKAYPDEKYRKEVVSAWKEDLVERFEIGQIKPRVFKVRCKNDQDKIINFRAVALKDRKQFLTYEDITDRKEAEDAILQSKEHYQTLVEESFDGIFVQKGTKIVFANRRLNEMLGYDEGELLNLDHWLVYHPDYQELTRERAQLRMKGEAVPSHYEVKLSRKDGSWFYGEINARAIGFTGEPGIQVWIKDITERRQAEKALRDSEQRYRSVFENTGAATVIIEKDNTLSMMNTEFEKLSGYSQDEVVDKKRWMDFVHPKDLEKTKRDLSIRRENEGKASTEYEFRFVDKQGSIKDIISTVGIISGTKKSVASLMDVTFRKQAEEAVRQSEQRYRFLVENVLLGLFICEMPSGRFLFLNQRIREMFGYERDEGLDTSVWNVIHPDDHNLLKKRIEAKSKGKLPASDSAIYTAIKKNGSHFRVEVNASPVTYQGISAMQGVVMDVTEKELLEKQLQQAQKMEAIGTLAGGIAHDFNNLLMAMQGNSSLMLLDVDPGHPHHEKLKSSEQYVQRGANLTKQLLGFARGGKYEVRPTDLNELVMMSSKMFSRTKKEITLHSKYQQGLWTVEVDQGQIEQVLLNLYVNAWQAMPGGGDLFIQTENVMLDKTYAKLFKLAPGKYVKLTLIDTGVGMDGATIQRIFDPFFTTKEMGRGTGLGLASAYGIVKNHGGIIYVYSEIGEGTTFNIYLPASEKKIKKEKEPLRELLKASGTVLLVDDEDIIIDVGAQMLKSLGFEVLIAKNGEQANEIYEKNRERIDIVILDMIMPGMGGGKTYDKLREKDPDVKVLLSSGYSINGQATEILDRGCNGFIQKPFNIEKLSHSIRKIIGGD